MSNLSRRYISVHFNDSASLHRIGLPRPVKLQFFIHFFAKRYRSDFRVKKKTKYSYEKYLNIISILGNYNIPLFIFIFFILILLTLKLLEVINR